MCYYAMTYNKYCRRINVNKISIYLYAMRRCFYSFQEFFHNINTFLFTESDLDCFQHFTVF